MTIEDLRVIAKALGVTMAKANASPEPEIVRVVDSTNVITALALAGEFVQFTVGTPFGSDVLVTVSQIGGGLG